MSFQGIAAIVNGTVFVTYVYITAIFMHWTNVFLGVVLYFSMSRFAAKYQNSLMKVKVLDNIQKSPVYSEFNAAITGLIPIRCYNQGGNFLRKFLKLVNNQSTTELSFFFI